MTHKLEGYNGKVLVGNRGGAEINLGRGTAVGGRGIAVGGSGNRGRSGNLGPGSGSQVAAFSQDSPLRASLCVSMDVKIYLDRIHRDPKVCGGQPVIAGTRVPLKTVLASLAEGASVEEIVSDFPSLTEADVRAVIAYAAASAVDDLPVPAVPTGP